jgi:hypothetical protein
MSTPEHAMRIYVSVWNATDEQGRTRLAEQALTEDAVVMYPTIVAHGRSELVAAIGQFQQQVPDASFVETSGIEHHHGWLRASWQLVQSSRLRSAPPPLPSRLTATRFHRLTCAGGAANRRVRTTVWCSTTRDRRSMTSVFPGGERHARRVR